MRTPFLLRPARPRSRALLLSLALSLLCTLIPASHAQIRGAGAVQERAGRTEQSILTLEALRRSIASKAQELRERQAEAAAVEDPDLRLELLVEAREVQAELEALRANFESVATGIDVTEFIQARRKELDIKEELEKLLRPILEQLREATETPRQIEELRSSLAYYEERERVAQRAIAQIDLLLEAQPEPDLRAELERSRSAWQQRRGEVQNQQTFARYQLDTKLQGRRSLLDSGRLLLGTFFRERGLNLLFAVGTMVGVFVAFRWLYRILRRVSPIHRRPELPFYTRLLDVLYHGLTSVAALASGLLVLYAAGDWVLLGLALLFLLGLAWASKSTLPHFVDQIRLLLNLGTVREGERVVHEGLPWRVGRIGFRAILTNPELSGGLLRLPVRDLVGMRSRPSAPDEPWFPTRQHEWIRVADGRVCQVLHQTPQQVRVRMLGGSVVTFPIGSFLELSPELLSGGFRVAVVFGIDYAHQAICTAEVPAIMKQRVEAGLLQLVARGELAALTVEFREAGSSSLDYAVHADFHGSLAPRAEFLRRAIQRILVDTCNEEGWTIPFTQLTVHQAAAAS